MTRVALLQIDVSDTEPVDVRIKRVLDLVEGLAGKCDIAVLPELWHVGAFNNAALRPHAVSRDSELITSLQAATKSAGIWLHAGSFVELHDGDKLSNTSLVIRPDGTVAEFYRKIHLFGFDQGEAIMLERGDDVVIVDNSPVGRAGIATCYDLRFPELFRAQQEQGAQTFLLCSGWPTPRINHWRVLIQARAIENQAWFIACNEVGVNGDYILGGNSMIVSPRGDIVCEAGATEEILFADIDVDMADEWRQSFPILRDRVMR